MPTLERAYTPDALAMACTELMSAQVNFPDRRTIWFEPCVGGGAFARAILAHDFLPVTNDLDPGVEADFHEDATHFAPPAAVAAVITNPPFSRAFELLKFWFAREVPVGLLLRATFIAGTAERGDWLYENPPAHVARILPRPKFLGPDQTKKGSDSTEYEFCIWDPRHRRLPPPRSTYSLLKWKDFPVKK